MMDSKHTEGGWHKSRGTTTAWEVVSDVAPKTRRVVARCGGPDREGNAQLIAAAPDLLEAVKSFVKAEDDVKNSDISINDYDKAMEAARVLGISAIAKAEGRSTPLPADGRE